MPPGCEQAQRLPPGLLHTRFPLLKSPVLAASDAPPGTHSRSGGRGAVPALGGPSAPTGEAPGPGNEGP